MRQRPFLTLFVLGLVGVISLIPLLAEVLARNPLPAGAPRLPLPGLIALSLVQPTLLMAIGVAVGLRLAPRLGLRSYVVDRANAGVAVWPPLRQDLPLAVAAGVAQTTLMVGLDRAFRPFMGEAWRRLEANDPLGPPIVSLVAGLFYGGITEELMLRWGLMSLFAWLVWRFGGGQAGTPPRASVMWVAVLASALLFGAGHLPATGMLVPLTAVIVVRTVVLNAIAGVVFGWLFWRRSLEAAMVAHAASHVVLFTVRLVSR